MSTSKSTIFHPLLATAVVALGVTTAFAQTTATTTDGVADTSTASTIDTTCVPVSLARQVAEPYSYGYPDGRSQVQYRYAYSYRTPRRYYRPFRVYYYGTAYRYPPGVYPRTANMIYYGPAVKVYGSPWIYAR